MNTFGLFLKAILLGIYVCLPIGPINILSTHRMVRYGFRLGIQGAMGGLAMDLIYVTLSGLGLSTVIGFVEAHPTTFRILGTPVILAVAVLMLRTATPPVNDDDATPPRGRDLFLSTFGLCIASPSAIIGITVALGLFGLGRAVTSFGNWLTVMIGMLVGGVGFWILMGRTLSRISHRLEPSLFTWVSRGVATLLIALAFINVWQLLQ